jgi:hypothetical protein
MKNKETKNPNAFPLFIDVNQNSEVHDGMTLRDYFAAKAMQSLISEGNLRGGINEYTVISRHAYCCADEMLKERGE